MNDVTGPSFPVRQKTFNLEIKGNKTDMVICSYEDHFFVLATQIGSMGTILHARKEEGVTTDPTFEVSIIFGKRDEPMMIACGRQLIELISKSGSLKPLILSLGLKDHSMETLKCIVSAVTENCLCEVSSGNSGLLLPFLLIIMGTWVLICSYNQLTFCSSYLLKLVFSEAG